MTSTISLSEQNRKVARNGAIGERYAAIVYDTQIAVNALIDGEHQGLPLEVKTSQIWVRDASNSKNRRRGRYLLDQTQHDYLLDNNGLYAFVLLDQAEEIIFSRLVFAKDVPMPEKSMQVVWTRIFEEFD